MPGGKVVGFFINVDNIGAHAPDEAAQLRVEVQVKVAVQGDGLNSQLIALEVCSLQAPHAAPAPHMIARRGGKIVNISSVAAEKGGRGQTNYAASKGAINAFTRALAVELAPRGITVCGRDC